MAIPKSIPKHWLQVHYAFTSDAQMSANQEQSMLAKNSMFSGRLSGAAGVD
jgi:hypothetical protein